MKIKNRRQIFLQAAGILACALLLASLSALVWAGTPPKIFIQPDRHDFGKIAEGVKVKHVFHIRNKGGTPLVITDAKPTCDCTTVKLDTKEVKPGKSIVMEVTVDTTMKLGEITKEILVTSNDPVCPQTKIKLFAVVDPHEGMDGKGPSKLFSPKCAACHVQQGIGKIGEDLYMADCAMCHGFRANGANAPSLVRYNLEDAAVRGLLRDITANGSKAHLSAMPGFIKEAGGPLTGEEIDSLIEYLRWRKSIH